MLIGGLCMLDPGLEVPGGSGGVQMTLVEFFESDLDAGTSTEELAVSPSLTDDDLYEDEGQTVERLSSSSPLAFPTSDEDDLAPAPTPKLPARSKHAAGSKSKTPKPLAKGAQAAKDLVSFVLVIPSGTADNTVRVHVQIEEADYKTILDSIHEVIGCKGIKAKALPELSYQITGTKAAKTAFNGPQSLNNLISDCRSFAECKKSADAPLVNIVVAAKWLADFRKWMESKGAKKQGAAKKPITFDGSSDVEGDGDDDTDTLASMDTNERRIFAQLQKKYMSCPKCGERVIRIIVGSTHLVLTYQQLRAWAAALAAKQYKLTDIRPPHNKFFQAYWDLRPKKHRSTPGSDDDAPAPPAPQPAPAPPALPTPPFYGYPGYPYPYPPPPPPPVETPAPRGQRRPASPMPSSDAPEPTDQPSRYPNIHAFFDALDAVEENKERQLPYWATIIIDGGYSNIDELQEFTVDDLAKEFAIHKRGHANFMLMKIRAEIARLDKLAKREKRARV
ncbi:hypothetical protein AURDEDRAFT_131014 [Auricularia subglabra TFB-10046 SS5]|uniref:Uncharacterized protein n=1 Tax=Auricularia subglabra (strain TFB-10046 / SS5) TaxID=717982 RepID=J0D707_AURST|nr:hypothetical protein AURDEDRAFT_131014 [Auricularia subglabra TFB-10046 SS5]